jgi:CheY-like chemotaxis protein
VTKTLLAVDDSATMRKVLEITFGGEDFRVLTADRAHHALDRMGEGPVAVVIDTSLPDGDDGYTLAKEVRSRDPRTVIVLMASRYNPYDASRGKEAGVDDYVDKPFDTQALIEKVKKAIVARESGKPAVVAAAPAMPSITSTVTGPGPAAPHVVPPFGGTPRPPVAAPVIARPTFPTQRTNTLSFEGGPPAPPISAPPPQPVAPISRTAPSGMPIVQPPKPAEHAPPPPPARAPVAASRSPEPAAQVASASAAVNGQLAGKLGDLGLTPAQVDAVLALSREVVERVVWEVVPQLAETIIKEEIARLTKD